MLAAALAKGPVAVVCDSSHTRERLLAHHPAAPAEVVHPGLTPPPADRPARTPGDYFLTVASIEPRKNHLGLLRAFRLARERGFELRWKIVGPPGPRHEPILAELHAQDGVDVLGRVSQDELERLYAGARFLASPSHLEGFGYPPLEAMARGVAVACSTGSGMDDTVGESGLRIGAEDVEGWADALLSLQTDDSHRQELERAGFERVTHFGWASASGRLIDIHREVHQHARTNR